MTQRALTAALISFGLLFAAVIARNGDLALMALPFLAYLAAGVAVAPAQGQIRLSADRAVNVLSAGEVTEVEVRLAVRNQGRAILALRLCEPLLPGMRATGGDLRQQGSLLCATIALAAGAEAELRYTFETARGSFRWENLWVVAGAPLGLFQSKLTLPAAAEVQVRPRTSKLRPIPLQPENTLHAPGPLPAHLAGSGTDFWGVREYHPGDPLRRLDWRLAARHPGRLFTREFEQEELADVGLILDARRKSDVCIGEDSLFEHSVGATASLAENFLHAGHRVSLLILGDRLTIVYPGYGKVQLNRILRILAQARPAQEDTSVMLDYLPVRMFASRALLVVVSAMAPGDWRLFPRLRAHGNQGLLICPDPLAFALPSLAQDRAGGLAVRATRLERRLELARIAEYGVRVIDWPVDQPILPLVLAAFRRGRRRPA